MRKRKLITEMTMDELINEYYRIDGLLPTFCGNCMIERLETKEKIEQRLKNDFDYIIIK